MAEPWAYRGRDVFSGQDVDGQAATIDTVESAAMIEEIQQRIGQLQDSQGGGALGFKTWSELAGVTGAVVGALGRVTDDGGTHADPVVGGTVDNEGLYRWSASPAGWERIGDDESGRLDALESELEDKADASALSAHANASNNPHAVTKSQVGLGNVDNTSDMNKPISAAQQEAFDAEALARRIEATDARSRGISRDGTPGYAWHIEGADGKIALALTQEASLEFIDWHALAGSGRDGGYLFYVADTALRTALGIRPDGHVMLAAAEMPISSKRDGIDYAWAVTDLDGQIAIGVKHNGQVDIPTVFEGLVWPPPSSFSTEYTAAQIRNYGPYSLALKSERGVTAEIRKNAGSDTAVVQHPDPITFLPCYGQSNAGYGGNAGGPLVSQPWWPHSSLGFSPYLTITPADPIDDTDLIGLAPMRDMPDWANSAPATTIAASWEWLHRSEYQISPGMLTWTAWEGGAPLSSFVRDSTNWNNLMAGAAAARREAAKYGRGEIHCPALVWVQGEAGPYTGYQAALEALADDLLPELQTQMSLEAEPDMLIVQVNDGSLGSAERTAVRLAQLAAARSHPDIFLAGPMYPVPAIDGIHPSPLGRMMFGDMVAVAVKQLADTGSFTPLWPTAVVRIGDVITVTFAVPGDGLAFDTDWIAPAPDYGFEYVDDSSSAEISSVSIVSTTAIQITLSATPSGANPKLRYAIEANQASPWTRGRGQLYSPTTIPSLFAKEGHLVPANVRHYCVIFEEPVTN